MDMTYWLKPKLPVHVYVIIIMLMESDIQTMPGVLYSWVSGLLRPYLQAIAISLVWVGGMNRHFDY